MIFVELVTIFINIDDGCISLYTTLQTQSDEKITKMKRNYMSNMNMNTLGIVCQFINYFRGKHLLAFQSSQHGLAF